MPHSAHYHTTYATLSDLLISTALTSATAVLLLLSAIGILIVKKSAGAAYANGLAWSFLGIGLLTVVTTITIYFQLFGVNDRLIGLFLLPFLVAMICNLRAAVAFNSIARY
jgi:hypothetical protein